MIGVLIHFDTVQGKFKGQGNRSNVKVTGGKISPK